MHSYRSCIHRGFRRYLISDVSLRLPGRVKNLDILHEVKYKNVLNFQRIWQQCVSFSTIRKMKIALQSLSSGLCAHSTEEYCKTDLSRK